MNDFFIKVAGIQMFTKTLCFYYYHNLRHNNCHQALYIPLQLHSVKYTEIPEDLENINVEENKHES